jgi:hypothetical protein
MISTSTPARGRVPFLQRMLTSIISNAHDFSNFEILFAIDNDDLDTAKEIELFLEGKGVNYKIIYFERLFYKNIHKYMWGLFEHAKGDYMWLFPDDLEIQTPNWDLILSKYKNEMYLQPRLPCFYDAWKFSIVPIVSRKWFEITGRVAENSQYDVWLGGIAERLGIVTRVEELLCCLFNASDGTQHNTHDLDKPDIKLEWKKDEDMLREYLAHVKNENK